MNISLHNSPLKCGCIMCFPDTLVLHYNIILIQRLKYLILNKLEAKCLLESSREINDIFLI